MVRWQHLQAHIHAKIKYITSNHDTKYEYLFLIYRPLCRPFFHLPHKGKTCSLQPLCLLFHTSSLATFY